MTIFLLRHGNAEVRAATDRERGLTETGRAEVRRVLAGSEHELREVAAIWVSPYRRALETLDEARSFLPDVEVRQCDFLTPSSNPNVVIAQMQSSGLTSLILVSHQPLLGSLLDELCDFEPGRYRLGTGSLAAVQTEGLVARGLGELAWLRHP